MINEFILTLRLTNKNVRFFMFCIFINSFTASALNVMLGIYYTNIGFSELIIGNLLSLRTFGSSFGAIFALILARKVGNKNTLYIAFATMLVSGLMFVNVIFIPVMQVASIMFGAASITLTVLQAPFFKKNSTDETVVGVFSASFVLSNVSMFIASFLFGSLSDFFATFGGVTFGSKLVLNIAVLSLAFALFAVHKLNFDEEVVVAKPRDQKKKFAITGYFSFLTRDAALYLTKVASIGIGAGLIVPFFNVYIKHALNTTDTVVGNILAFAQLGTVLGGLAVPYLSRKLGKLNFVLACQLVSIPFLISISLPQGPVVMAISFFFRTALMNMANPVLLGMAMDLVEEQDRTSMSSVFSLIDSICRTIGTQTGGYMMMAVSYNSPYYLTIVFYLLSSIVVYLIFGKTDKYKNM